MNVYLDSIGCRLNQSELELFARQFRLAGHALVPSSDQADLVVINTCTVTAQAASDSRQKVRQAARSGGAQIVVTGCWSSLQPAEAAALPGVSRVVPNAAKDSLVPDLLGQPLEIFDLEAIQREPIPGARLRTRAFIKAQDGCDNRCTFCITSLARGRGRSRSIHDVVQDVQSAIQGGAQEAVLSGVHLGSWGQDFGSGWHLKDLIQAVLDETAIPRLRLSSLEPWDLSADFFRLWADARLCRHLHLPLQSGCAATLRRMARKTTPAAFSELAAAARQAIPGLSLTTDIIVGFPGETEAEFGESLAFIQSMHFSGGHVFTYSPRPGTAAARMPDQVLNHTRKIRNAALRQVLAESQQRYQAGFIGAELDVLWESLTSLEPHRWVMSGLSDNNLRISARLPAHAWNQVTRLRLVKQTADGLWGELAA